MNDKHLYRLLEIVMKKSDVRQLILEGLNYKQIGELTSLALRDGFLIYEKKELILSDKGLYKIEKDENLYKKTDKSEWIMPEIKSRIKRIDKNDIFLPNQDELSF